MKKLQTALLLNLLIPSTAFAFQPGAGSGIYGMLFFIYGGPALLIISIFLLTVVRTVIGTKKAFKIVGYLFLGFILIELGLFILAASGI